MFERSAIKWLLEWKEKSTRKPLIIRGARQVGKTSLVKEFGKSFDLFIALNLDRAEDLSLFEQDVSVQTLFDSILFLQNKKRPQGSVLLFIDEIQNSENAIKLLRYFYEDMPEIHVIAAGSLLETLLKVQVSFPVGRVEYMALRPCSFYEFLGALGESQLQEVLENIAVNELIHSRMLLLFNRYVLVGGMPQVVAQYANTHDLVSLNPIYQTLLAGYRDDVEKYEKSAAMRNVIRYIITNGFGLAGQRISFENFASSNYKSREVGDALRTLQKALLLDLVYPTVETKPPLLPDHKKKPKLFWLDTGLMNFAAGIQREVFEKEDINDAWRGFAAEHIAAQELWAASFDYIHQRRFWAREAKSSQAEVDFLYSDFEHGVVPIEVKSGHNSKLKSLHLFMENSPASIAIRFWAKPASSDCIKLPSGKEFRLLNLPYYYAGFIGKYLSKLKGT